MNKFREYVKEQVDIHTRNRAYQMEKCSDKFREQLINEITDDFVESTQCAIENGIKNETLRIVYQLEDYSCERVNDEIYDLIKRC